MTTTMRTFATTTTVAVAVAVFTAIAAVITAVVCHLLNHLHQLHNDIEHIHHRKRSSTAGIKH